MVVLDKLERKRECVSFTPGVFVPKFLPRRQAGTPGVFPTLLPCFRGLGVVLGKDVLGDGERNLVSGATAFQQYRHDELGTVERAKAGPPGVRLVLSPKLRGPGFARHRNRHTLEPPGRSIGHPLTHAIPDDSEVLIVNDRLLTRSRWRNPSAGSGPACRRGGVVPPKQKRGL